MTSYCYGWAKIYFRTLILLAEREQTRQPADKKPVAQILNRIFLGGPA